MTRKEQQAYLGEVFADAKSDVPFKRALGSFRKTARRKITDLKEIFIYLFARGKDLREVPDEAGYSMMQLPGDLRFSSRMISP